MTRGDLVSVQPMVNPDFYTRAAERTVRRMLDHPSIIYAPYVPFYTTPTVFGDDHMREITANKEELLSKLKTNRESHVEAFKEARAGWIDAARNALKGALTLLENAAETGGEFPDLSFQEIRQDQPRCFVGEYDRAIAMLEIHTGETIDLSGDDVERFYLDRWNWSNEFFASAGKYSGGVSEQRRAGRLGRAERF